MIVLSGVSIRAQRCLDGDDWPHYLATIEACPTWWDPRLGTSKPAESPGLPPTWTTNLVVGLDHPMIETFRRMPRQPGDSHVWLYDPAGFTVVVAPVWESVGDVLPMTRGPKDVVREHKASAKIALADLIDHLGGES